MLHNYVDITKQIFLKNLTNKDYKVFLFGSRACGNEKKYSDIDVGIMGKNKLPVLIKFAIEDEIDESIVPFKVDIVDFYDVDEKFRKQALSKVIFWQK
jgi:uncharacterized protein